MRHHATVTLLLLGLAPAATAQSEAYCALRDPTRQIYTIYPGADTHRSIVRTVNAKARDEVAKVLPFGLHFNELGQHTLYVAAKGQVPVGLVHVRSETGRWGLMEIAWALDIDLQVRDFTFQRCRSRYRRRLLDDSFRKQLQGKGLEELGRLLTSDGKRINRTRLRVPKGTEELATALVRSAMKTIVVTRSVWEKDLRILRVLHEGLTAFPGSVGLRPAKKAYTREVLSDVATRLKTGDTIFERSTVQVLVVLDGEKNVLGCVVRADWNAGVHELTTWWKVDRAGRLLAVTVSGGWPDPEIRRSFEEHVGKTKSDLVGCRVPTELAAMEALLLADHHLAK